jgi:hypothetical protein
MLSPCQLVGLTPDLLGVQGLNSIVVEDTNIYNYI